MSKTLLLTVFACAVVATTACVAPLPEGKSGVIAMIPFTSEEHQIRGNAPLEGWSDQAVLNQESFPGTMEELIAIITDKTDLVQLPKPAGAYESAYLTWDLYTFTTRIPEGGPCLFRVDMALAKAGQDAGYYTVILITRPMEYRANREMYQTAFEHVLYALTPLE